MYFARRRHPLPAKTAKNHKTRLKSVKTVRSRKVLHILSVKPFLKNLPKPLDKAGLLCYNDIAISYGAMAKW